MTCKQVSKPEYLCDIWQYTETGDIPWIGECDMNQLMGGKLLSWFTDRGEEMMSESGMRYKRKKFSQSIIGSLLYANRSITR